MKALPPDILAELQVEYIKGFPQKITDIDEALMNKQWPTLIELLHKLVGSGATYQMPEITDHAREAETYLEKNPSPDLNKITALVKSLTAILKNHILEAA
ncbi:MAG: Hpt domain-containing protein [Oligoflexia bacterium]|nr:Hpt domain-containing protein [Oligoflexia bacterium]